MRQLAGTAVAFGGLAVITVATSTSGIPLLAIVLILLAACSWAIGNVLMRGAGPFDHFAMIVWLCLIPPLPMLALSLVFEGYGPVVHALSAAGWVDGVLLLYLSVLATILGFGRLGAIC